MKRFIVIALVMCLLFPALAQAERWGKAFDITYDEVTTRYSNAPDIIYGEETPLVFLDLGASDYRRTYFAEAKPAFDIALVCEDFSDKVVFVYSSIVFDRIADYDEAVVAGGAFTMLVARLLFAIDEQMGPEAASGLFGDGNIFTEVINKEGAQLDKIIGDMYFAAVNTGDEVQLMVRRNDFYESKEEFLEYVEGY